MSKIFLLIINIIVTAIMVNGQNEIFSKSFSYGLRQAVTELLYEDDNYYYAMGYAEDSIGYELGLSVSLHDKISGQAIHTSYFEIDSTWMFIGNSIRVHDINDTLYFCANARGKVYIMAYSKESHNLFIHRSVVNPNEGGAYTHDMMREENRFLISFTASGDDFSQPAIWIANDNGSNEIKILNENDRLVLSGKFIRMDNGNYLFTSTWTPRGEYKYTINISELDSNFNLIWTWSTPEWEKAFSSSEILHINEEEILLMYRAELQDELYERRAWPHHIMRFNHKTKKVIWKKNVAFPVCSFSNYLGSMVKSQRDAETVLLVTHVYGDNVRTDSLIVKGRVQKINYNGQVLWQRDYTIYNRVPFTPNSFYNIINTMDGHYLIGGETYDRQIVAWLVKINEDGHILGDTTSSILWEQEKWKEDISIYPNPVQNLLYINQDEIQDIEYVLMDISGRVVEKIFQINAHSSFVWDISHLSKGTYILSIRKNGKVIGSSKILKV